MTKNKKQPNNISKMFLTVGGFLLILLLAFFIQLFLDKDCCPCGASNGCCPCPNTKYINEVEEWAGYDASGAGSWNYMCEEYKKETNKTFNCFVEK